MQSLRIEVMEVKVEGKPYLLMNAGEFTGVVAEMPVSDEDQEQMKHQVMLRANHYLSLPDDYELKHGEDISLSDIKASIQKNIVESEA